MPWRTGRPPENLFSHFPALVKANRWPPTNLPDNHKRMTPGRLLAVYLATWMRESRRHRPEEIGKQSRQLALNEDHTWRSNTVITCLLGFSSKRWWSGRKNSDTTCELQPKSGGWYFPVIGKSKEPQSILHQLSLLACCPVPAYPFTYDSFSATFPSRTRKTSTPRMWPSVPSSLVQE